MTDDELKRLFESLRQESRSDFQEIADRLAADSRQQLEITRSEFRETTTRVAADSRNQVEVAIEHFNDRFDLLGEAIALVDEKLDRKTSSIEDRMDRGFAETQAMIKFSHDELDRRVRALEQSHQTLEEKHRTVEETLSDLQARVDRLEGSTH
ncbi:MAG: hypothetical protein QOH21_571 [Acidobacteriota bacterium]|nr:hypothetical protein [Acidobacteriota bacterium]